MALQKKTSLAAPAEDAGWIKLDWKELMATKSPAPAFPREALPPRLGETIASIATARCVNFDLMAAAILATTSGAIGNRVRIGLTESRAEPLTLFMVLVASPGEGKSEALGVSRTVLTAIEQPRSTVSSVVGPFADEIDRKRTVTALKAIARDGDAIVSDALSKSGGSGRRLLVTDFTVAGIRDALLDHPEGGVVLADELVGVMGVSGGADSMRSRAVMLEAHDGNPRVFVNARDGEICVPALQLTILGGTQPDRVGLLVGKAIDGMVPRFLWCAPDVARINELAESDGDMPALMAATGRLSTIKSGGKGNAFPTIIGVAPEARAVLAAANAGWNDRMANATVMSRSLLARARAQAIRLAGVMALAERALASEAPLPGEAITAAEAERGVMLMDRYFLPMAERATGELQHRAQETPAAQLARYLAQIGKPEVSARDDIRRGIGSPLRDADIIASAFEELRLRGFVRELPHSGPGRPAKRFLVNPSLLGMQ